MNRPELIMLIGLPGSGKSTFANNYIKNHSDTCIMSSDSIRKELYGDESIQKDPSKVFSLMQDRTLENLDKGISVIYDATNLTRKDRNGMIGKCPKGILITAIVIWADVNTCKERDAQRSRNVGPEVIDRMIKRFQAPFYDEGFTSVRIFNSESLDSDFGIEYEKRILDAMHIPHDNPHHSANIFDHCSNAAEYIKQKDLPDELYHAALLHDIGKPYTKSFTDSKGNPSDVAHYYQHQCVGAYLSYGLPYVTPFVAWLISTHMDPFLNTKYYNQLIRYLKDAIDILHEADLNAH